MIYILELSEPLSPRHTSRFYIGYARDKTQVYKRLQKHHEGRGARFTQVAVERNIQFWLVCLIDGTKKVERRLKNRHNARLIVERARKGTLRERVLWYAGME